MEKIKLWFIYEPVSIKRELSPVTKKVIVLIKGIEKGYNQKEFDLRSIDYSRFLLESKVKIDKKDLPIVLINNKITFIKKLPSITELSQKVAELREREMR